MCVSVVSLRSKDQITTTPNMFNAQCTTWENNIKVSESLEGNYFGANVLQLQNANCEFLFGFLDSQ